MSRYMNGDDRRFYIQISTLELAVIHKHPIASDDLWNNIVIADIDRFLQALRSRASACLLECLHVQV